MDGSEWSGSMTFEDVRTWIRGASREDLAALNPMIKLRYDQLGAENGMSFRLGETVQFDSKKGTIRGKFLGISRKNAKVVTDAGLQWTVSPGLLRKVGEMAKSSV